MTFPRILTALAVVSSVSAQSLPLTNIRSITGTDRSDNAGMAEEPLLRMCPNLTYPDMIGETMWNNANPRKISNLLMKETGGGETNDRNLLDMVWQWGQFIDHDLDLTEGAPGFGNISVSMLDNGGVADIFADNGCSSISMSRSEYRMGAMVGMGFVREQENHITSFLDGSGVYGSDAHREAMLRVSTDSCHLKTTDNGKLLPKNDFMLSNAMSDSAAFFVAGDIRANEQVGLTAMHTLFVREHNRLCDAIIAHYPGETAERQYQMARKVVGAEIQVITYKEFLPALMGPNAPDYASYAGFSDAVNPSIANEFSTAAYRFGHTMLSSSFPLANNAGPIDGEVVELKDVFFVADYFDNDSQLVDHVLGGLQEQLAQEIDPILTDAVRDFLFGEVNTPGKCLDLAVLNIERGRDHGIPSYNDLREYFGLGRRADYTEVTTDTQRRAQLNAAYDNVDMIDAWVGMLAEDHMPDSSVGELLTYIMKDQFERLMNGDPFFWKRDNDLKDATFKADVIDIEAVTLQMIIGRNTVIQKPASQSAFIKGPVVKSAEFPFTNATARAIDGDDRDDHLGMAETPLMRMAPAEMMTFVDGKAEMMLGINARLISTAVFDQKSNMPNNRGMTDMVWQWGQFLDHDLDLTEGNVDMNGETTVFIPMIDSDPFIAGSCRKISMARSDFVPDGDDVRQQTNGITAFVDASNVYGSDDARAEELRSHVGGKLKVGPNNLLPKNVNGMSNAPDADPKFFLAGDIRANEQVGLTAMHTLFMREHNRLCDDLANYYPGKTDEEYYQMARKIVIGEVQAITYKEFLPALLGTMAPDLDTWVGYNATVDPTIANEFSTMAYRVGHTMISGDLLLANHQGPFGSVQLRDMFFDPTPFDNDPHFLDHVIGGLMEQLCQEVDAFVVDDVRNFLFGGADGEGTCHDLVALNIQRGRDHGLPMYNDMRDMMKLGKHTEFSDITSDPDVAAALQSVYHTVNHVDAWVGALAEDHVEGSSVGPLIGEIIKDQMERLMHGDPHFYLGETDLFDADLMLNIMNVNECTLQLIIKRNTNIDHDASVSAFIVEEVTPLSNMPLTSRRTMDGSDREDNKGEEHVPLMRMNGPGSAKYTGREGMHQGPNARLVSNTVCAQADDNGDHVDIINPNGLLDMVWQWGQFLDHDIGLTEGAEANGEMTIPLPAGDYFEVEGCPGIDFQRSIFVYQGNKRQQINEITSFVDASNVYGSDETRAKALRTMENGELKTSQNGLNLPYNLDRLANAGGDQNTSFVAGDVRANEQIGLIAMHTLFVREHNRLADLIKDHYGAGISDEDIYQMARKIVTAEIQQVTYKEFLPVLLGPTYTPDLSTYSGYDPSVDPSLANEFSGAVYRFGHSMISPQILMSFDGKSVDSNMSLASSFFSPEIYLSNPYTCDMVLGGLMLQDAQLVDTKIINNLRLFLFQSPDASGCMDLATFNIQRGRDHGVPLYNDLREIMGLPRKKSFAEITLDSEVRAQLAQVYTTVDDIETWVGVLAEDHVIGGNVGELLAKVMQDQFERLMHGDPMFWLGDADLEDADLKTIIDLNTTTLAKIIDWNTMLDRDSSLSAFARGDNPNPMSMPLTKTRSMDGSDRADNKGEADAPLMRMAPDKMTFTDAAGTMMSGPNPRAISNTLFHQDKKSILNNRGMLDMVWQWGQFLDHDIGLTEGAAGFGYANISLPPGDMMAANGCPHIEFTRSHFVNVSGSREPVNEITSFIDASMVYGSDDARGMELRTGTNGEMKTSGGGLSLPYNENAFPNAGGDNDPLLFLAGDIRANEQMGLIAMHTLFVREHNRLADRINTAYPGTSDDDVYQLARKLVTAEIQKITYGEFLPALMGSNAPVINCNTWLYDDTVDPSIANEFSTAMYRVGHSMISSDIPMSWGPGWGGFVWTENLLGSFFETDLFTSNAYTTDQIMGGLVARRCQEIDAKVVTVLRNFIFGLDGATGCVDLVALNIQRGRDHGIALYNDLREASGLPRVTSVDQITTNQQVRNALENLYGKDADSGFDNIDAWVGGLAEDHENDSSLGPLMQTIITDQFQRLSDGDPNFYCGDVDVWNAEVRVHVLDIEELTLSKVIEYNTIISRDSTLSAFMEA